MMISATKAGVLLLFLCLNTCVLAQNDTSSEISVPFQVDLSGRSLLSDDELSITCVKCTADGDFSLSGGTGNQPDSNFTSLPFDFTEDWVGAVVEDFKVYIELDFSLTPTNATNEITVPLLTQDGISYTQNFGALGVTWTFDPVLHGWVNCSKPANFSYGFEFTIPANSAIFIPVFHLDEIKSVGFSNSSIVPLNYTSSDPNDDFAFELSFRPIFKANIDVATIETPLYAEAFADVPKLDVTVSQVANVTKDCRPAAPGTASDQVFHNLTYVVPTLGFDFGFNATAIDTILLPVGDDVSLPTSCLDFMPKSNALAAVPDKSNDGPRLGSQSAVAWILLFVAAMNLVWH